VPYLFQGIGQPGGDSWSEEGKLVRACSKFSSPGDAENLANKPYPEPVKGLQLQKSNSSICRLADSECSMLW